MLWIASGLLTLSCSLWDWVHLGARNWKKRKKKNSNRGSFHSFRTRDVPFPSPSKQRGIFSLVFWLPYVAGAAGTATTTVARVQLLTEVGCSRIRKVKKEKRKEEEKSRISSHSLLPQSPNFSIFWPETQGSSWNFLCSHSSGI